MASLVDFGIIAGTGAVRLDQEALVLAALFGGAAVLQRRGVGTLGTLVLVLLCLDVLGWMLPAAISQIEAGDGLTYFAVTSGLSVASATGVIAGVATLRRRQHAAPPPAPARGSRWPRYTVVAAALVFVVSLALCSARSDRSSAAAAGEIRIRMAHIAFSPDRAHHSGPEVTVATSNEDLFWHTFTISELGVDVRVPAGATRRVRFRADPGSYKYTCRIPGHDTAGMNGTLTIT